MSFFYPLVTRLRAHMSLCCFAVFYLGVVLIHAGQIMYDIRPGLITFTKNNLLIEPHPSPALYGGHILLSLGVVLAAGAAIAVGLHWLALRGADNFSLGMFAASALVSLYYIHLSQDWPFNYIVTGHYNHMVYIRQHWLSPEGYSGLEWFHPPLYFYVAAIVLWVSEHINAVELGTALRFLSWLCYLVFSGFSLLTLRMAGLSGAGYYASVALLLLWPGGIQFGPTISNESFYYAWYAGSFYYAVMWYQSGRERPLRLALILAGLALTARFNAEMLFVVLGALICVSWARGGFSLRSLLSRQWTITGAILLLCYLFAFCQPIHVHHSLLPPLMPDAYPVAPQTHFSVEHYLMLGYDNALVNPFPHDAPDETFLSNVLETSIFGCCGGGDIGLARPLVALSYMIVFYTFLPWLTALRAQWKGMLPFVTGFILPVLCLMAFVQARQMGVAHEVRYIYPAITCFAVWFGRSHALYKSRGVFLLTATGPVLAWSFALLSVIFYLGNP